MRGSCQPNRSMVLGPSGCTSLVNRFAYPELDLTPAVMSVIVGIPGGDGKKGYHGLIAYVPSPRPLGIDGSVFVGGVYDGGFGRDRYLTGDAVFDRQFRSYADSGEDMAAITPDVRSTFVKLQAALWPRCGQLRAHISSRGALVAFDRGLGAFDAPRTFARREDDVLGDLERIVAAVTLPLSLRRALSGPSKAE